MADTPDIVRQWTLLRTLSARRLGATTDDLAHDSGVSRRTIQRDLSLLKRLGFPIFETAGRRGLKTWNIDEQCGLTQLRFTLEEAAALYLGRQFLEPLAGTLFHMGAQSAFQKIRATLNEAPLRHLEKLAAAFYQTQRGWTDYGSKAAMIEDLSIAIERRRLTVITYQSLRSTEPVTFYDVHPYQLVYHRAALYLIAYSTDHQEIRTFKVDRISAADIHQLQFLAPRNFDPEQFLRSSFGIFEGKGEGAKVRVSFKPKVVRILDERQFHSSQKLIPQPDGSVIAEFRLSVFEEFVSWILSFGPEAEVFEPPQLRNQVAQVLQTTLERYSTPGPAQPDARKHPQKKNRKARPPR